MEKINSFKQLNIWSKGIEIVKEVYVLLRAFPNKEYRQFLRVALGSAAELETQLIIACEIGLITNEKLNIVSEKLDHLSRMISSLLNKLK